MAATACKNFLMAYACHLRHTNLTPPFSPLSHLVIYSPFSLPHCTPPPLLFLPWLPPLILSLLVASLAMLLTCSFPPSPCPSTMVPSTSLTDVTLSLLWLSTLPKLPSTAFLTSFILWFVFPFFCFYELRIGLSFCTVFSVICLRGYDGLMLVDMSLSEADN